MNEPSRYKQDKTITRQSINVKRHIFNVIDDIEKFEERDLNIGGDIATTSKGNVAWFKEKLMLAEAQEAGQILDEVQLAFLADPGISKASAAQQTIP
ncbi:hypothetical protein Tco_0926234 [Tanacetum coccineum]|uniref:Uncharacterized protein n=1 Tax=Tanacetum coccineum TaxID=301880 RepID=A0ABQ5DAC3_9ASTR